MRLAAFASLALLALAVPACAGIEAVAPDQRDLHAEAMDRLMSRDLGGEPEEAPDAQRDCTLTTLRPAA